MPDSKVHVIDFKAEPPRISTSLNLGKQPSGLDISVKGDLALVTSRGDGTVSLLSISGTQMSLIDTLILGSSAGQVREPQGICD